MIRVVLLSLLIFMVLLVAASFAWLNPDTAYLDLAFAEVEVRKSTAFVAAFAGGWLFGLICCAMPLLRLVNERRKLRKSVRLAEMEVNNLRSLPLRDAH